MSRRSSASSVAEAPKLAPPLRPRSDSDPAAPPDPASWDIFEPRAAEAPAAARAAHASHAAPPLPNGAHHARPNGAAGGQLDLQALKALSGAPLSHGLLCSFWNFLSSALLQKCISLLMFLMQEGGGGG